MKIRTSFVTNSSASCFVLAHKGKFSEETKKALLTYVENEFLGCEYLTPDGATEEEKERVYGFLHGWDTEEQEQQIEEALANKKNIYVGAVQFDSVDSIGDFYQDIWKIVSRTEPDFEVIDGDLNY